ncbi:MAG: dihydroxy-acid dehydratase [Acidimicrobiia bacterium]|nr:dihydroxy-acid dehydratase [Acidimicrobiia bacterium]
MRRHPFGGSALDHQETDVPYRSERVTTSPFAVGARALWRATGVHGDDFGKPLIAVVNSFTEFVPGHVHLADVGRRVCEGVWAAGGIAREFNTIAVDDGIAMGHDGMLYSLPSRDLIADSIEYMVNAHCVDAMVCISNCDKITPGMLMAGLRLNIPTVYVSGGAMEAGRVEVEGVEHRLAASDSALAFLDPTFLGGGMAQEVEEHSCPTCGSCSGMFTANSMNCLAEALGLALPGNGTLLATHMDRGRLFDESARRIVDLARRHYEDDDGTVLPRAVATRAAFTNAMAMDIAMGGSTNTILHLLALADEAGVDFTLDDIDVLSRRVPFLCTVSPATPDYYVEDVHKAGGVIGILGELERAGLIDTTVGTLVEPDGTLGDVLAAWDVRRSDDPAVHSFYAADASGRTGTPALSHETRTGVDLDRTAGCLRDVEHAHSPDGGLAVLYGNLAADGCIVKTGSVPDHMHRFQGPARIFDQQDQVAEALLGGGVGAGDVLVIRYEGPKGGPGMQEMLMPTLLMKGLGLAETAAIITDGRYSGASSGLAVGHISPEAAAGGTLALLEEGDLVTIDIAARALRVEVSDDELAARRARMDADPAGWKPMGERSRVVTRALAAYAAFATSADRGGVRRIP